MSDTSATVPFDDGKAPDAMRTIGEVASGLGIKQHVLRYWEQQFPMLRPMKRSGGRRLYRPDDVLLVAAIDRLINHEGYTLKGACQVIENGDVSTEQPVATPEPAQVSAALTAADVLPQLRVIRNRLSAALETA